MYIEALGFVLFCWGIFGSFSLKYHVMCKAHLVGFVQLENSEPFLLYAKNIFSCSTTATALVL